MHIAKWTVLWTQYQEAQGSIVMTVHVRSSQANCFFLFYPCSSCNDRYLVGMENTVWQTTNCLIPRIYKVAIASYWVNTIQFTYKTYNWRLHGIYCLLFKWNHLTNNPNGSIIHSFATLRRKQLFWVLSKYACFACCDGSCSLVMGFIAVQWAIGHTQENIT